MASHAKDHESPLVPALLDSILDQYRLSFWRGAHGPAHWARVRENGLRLAEVTGANHRVVELFSVFHDACRRNEGSDPKHGLRGAHLAEKLRRAHLNLNDAEFDLLFVACAEHTQGKTEADATIQTCWDADRLDLGRVWITPDPARLCTPAAREPEVLEWAQARSQGGFVPDLAHAWVRGE
jgi:uncharacterized protein